VERHGGRIRAQSAGRELGTTIVIELPAAMEAGSPPVAGRGDAVVADAMPAASLQVLLVEDHAPTRAAMAALLRRRGCRVVPAGTIDEARRCAADDSFDLLISDLGLPDGDGCVLMADLRALDPELRGIAITGFGMDADVARSRAAGFAEHLTKPVTMTSIDRALGRVLAARAQPRGAATT
jgi:CheY-like chemotaxis protein